MSNPTELPDIDRQLFEAEAAKRAVDLERSTMFPDRYKYQYAAFLWDFWQSARRAQPKGEAPQAEKVPCDQCSGTGGVMMAGDCADCNGKGFVWEPAAEKSESGAQATRAALAAQSQGAPALTPLDYRAQGREEALAIILAESAEDPFSAYTGWSKSGAPDDEGGAYWKEDELRALLHIGDRTHDAYDLAEGAYWEALGRKDEAARELLFAQQAPFYKPLHDFLSKHEAWDLMADLKRAQQAAAPGALAAWFDAEQKRLDAVSAYNAAVLVSEREIWPGRDINPEFQVMSAAQNAEFHARGALFASRAAPSAPGTPEAPADQDAKDAARYRWLRDKAREGSDVAPIVVMLDGGGTVVPDEVDCHGIRDGAALDSAVDAARAAQLDGGQGEGK